MAFTLDFWVNFSFFIWMLLEMLLISLKLPKRGARTDDRNSLGIVVVVMSVSIWLALWFKIAKIGDYYYGYPTLQYIGLALLWMGIFIRQGAAMQLDKQFTTKVAIVEGHQLVQTGFYRYLRHPSYTGALLSALGLALALGNWISALLLFLPVLGLLLYRIKIEEKVLADHFGSQYRNYMERTKRIIPFIY